MTVFAHGAKRVPLVAQPVTGDDARRVVRSDSFSAQVDDLLARYSAAGEAPAPPDRPSTAPASGSRIQRARTDQLPTVPRMCGPRIQRLIDIRGQTLDQLLAVYPPMMPGLKQKALIADLKRLFNDGTTRTYAGGGTNADELAWIHQQITAEKEAREKAQKEKAASARAAKNKQQQQEQPQVKTIQGPQPVVPKAFIQPDVFWQNKADEARDQAWADHDHHRAQSLSVDDVESRIRQWVKGGATKHDGLTFGEHQLGTADYADLTNRLEDLNLGCFSLTKGSGQHSTELQYKVFIGGTSTMSDKAKTFHIQRGVINNAYLYGQYLGDYEIMQANSFEATIKQQGVATWDEDYNAVIRDTVGVHAAAEVLAKK